MEISREYNGHSAQVNREQIKPIPQWSGERVGLGKAFCSIMDDIMKWFMSYRRLYQTLQCAQYRETESKGKTKNEVSKANMQRNGKSSIETELCPQRN